MTRRVKVACATITPSGSDGDEGRTVRLAACRSRAETPWRAIPAKPLERDLPVLNNYRNVLAPVLVRHGATDEALKSVFPEFSLSPFALFG